MTFLSCLVHVGFITLCLSEPVLHRSSRCPPRLPYDPPRVQQVSASGRAGTPRIVNGDIISPNLLPYVAALLRVENSALRFWCTATFVSSRWLISAAHCFEDSFGLARYYVLTGVGSLSETGILAEVVDVRVHPKFSYDFETTYGFDIAALRVETVQELDVKAMKVTVDAKVPREGVFVRAMGFGVTESGAPSDENVLRQVDMPVYNMKACNESYSNSLNESLQVCAGYEDGGCDSCQGDSGGPLIVYDALADPVLVGVVSFGLGCAEPNYPGVYVRTGAFESFLDENGVPYRKANQSLLETETETTQSNGGSLSVGVIAALATSAAVLATVLVVVGAFGTRVILFRIRRAPSEEAVDISEETAPRAVHIAEAQQVGEMGQVERHLYRP